MARNLAAAVLLTLSSLLNAGEMDDGLPDIDDTDDCVVDLVQPDGRTQHAPNASRLAGASSIFGVQIDHGWLIGDPANPSAAAAIQVTGDAARITMAVATESPDVDAAAYLLLPRALNECREIGMLKVVIDSDELSEESLKQVAQSCGYYFARRRDAGTVRAAEFYIDLYWKTGGGDA